MGETNETPMIVELQHKIRALEQANAELLMNNKRYHEAVQELEESIAVLVETNVLRALIDDISHDLRHPISTIANYLYLLKHQIEAENAQRYLGVMEKQLTFLTDIINNLIHMARLDLNITQFDFRPSHINKILTDIVEALYPVASRKDQAFLLDLQSELPPLLIDQLKVTRAIVNIVQNAVTYTPQHGKIYLRSMTDASGYIVIEIADTGIGIAPDDLPHIFDRFYRVSKTQTKGGNSGLGLAIAKRIVESHLGYIEVESEVGRGTRFRVYFPTTDG